MRQHGILVNRSGAASSQSKSFHFGNLSYRPARYNTAVSAKNRNAARTAENGTVISQAAMMVRKC